MDHLRGLFRAMGFTAVKTVLASGNVVFSSSSGDPQVLAKRIESQLQKELGYSVATLVRTPAELRRITEQATKYMGERAAWSAIYVMFFRDVLESDFKTMFQDLATETDNFHFSKCEVFWLVQGKLSASPLFKTGFGKITGELPTTMRNLNTVQKVLAVL